MNKNLVLGISALYMIVMLTLFSSLLFQEFSKVPVDDNIIKVDENGANQLLEIVNLNLLPGEAFTQEVFLKVSKTNTYEVQMDFIDVVNEGLIDFLVIEIHVNQGMFFSYNLSDLMNKSKEIRFELVIDKDINANFEIKFLLPQEIGNEAMKKSAKFNINLNVNPKGN